MKVGIIRFLALTVTGMCSTPGVGGGNQIMSVEPERLSNFDAIVILEDFYGDYLRAGP
jgi:hypothetical protein